MLECGFGIATLTRMDPCDLRLNNVSDGRGSICRVGQCVAGLYRYESHKIISWILLPQLSGLFKVALIRDSSISNPWEGMVRLDADKQYNLNAEVIIFLRKG